MPSHQKKHYALYIELLTYPSETTLITFYKVINVVSFRMPTIPKKYKYPLSAFYERTKIIPIMVAFCFMFW